MVFNGKTMEQVMDMSDFPWCVGEDGIVIREHPITYDMNGHGSYVR